MVCGSGRGDGLWPVAAWEQRGERHGKRWSAGAEGSDAAGGEHGAADEASHLETVFQAADVNILTADLLYGAAISV